LNVHNEETHSTKLSCPQDQSAHMQRTDFANSLIPN